MVRCPPPMRTAPSSQHNAMVAGDKVNVCTHTVATIGKPLAIFCVQTSGVGWGLGPALVKMTGNVQRHRQTGHALH